MHIAHERIDVELPILSGANVGDNVTRPPGSPQVGRDLLHEPIRADDRLVEYEKAHVDEVVDRG